MYYTFDRILLYNFQYFRFLDDIFRIVTPLWMASSHSDVHSYLDVIWSAAAFQIVFLDLQISTDFEGEL